MLPVSRFKNHFSSKLIRGNFQRSLVAGGMKLKAYPFKKIIDIDHAEDIAKAEEFIAEK